jgi:uncharacterized RDD family membrane protein YckC
VTSGTGNIGGAGGTSGDSRTSGSSAGFGRRLAALVYDALLLVGLLVAYTGIGVFLAHGEIQPETVGAWAYAYRTGLVMLVAGYYVLNWMHSGQTLGMRAWRLRAVNDLGKPLALGSAVLRFVFGLVAWAPAALGVLWLYLDPERLAIHDRLSKTRVVHLARS